MNDIEIAACMGWEAPADLVARAHRFEPIALDPCTAPDNPTDARSWVAPPRDGLSEDWSSLAGPEGHVWLCPPSAAVSLWAARAVRMRHELGHLTMLVSARTDESWYREAVRTGDALVYLAGRLESRIRCAACLREAGAPVRSYATMTFRESMHHTREYFCSRHAPRFSAHIRRSPYPALLFYFGKDTERWERVFSALGDLRRLNASQKRDNPLQSKLPLV